MDKEKILRDALKGQDLLGLKEILNINHRPHPYIVEGDFTEEQILKDGIKCIKCDLRYDEHKYDTVAFLELLRKGTANETEVILKKVVEECGEDFIDGFAFVETDKKWRIE